VSQDERRQAEIAAKEAELRRQTELAAKEAESRRQAEIAAKEAESRRQAELAAKKEAEFRRQAEIAAQKAEQKRQTEIAKLLSRLEALEASQAKIARKKAEGELFQFEIVTVFVVDVLWGGAKYVGDFDGYMLERLKEVVNQQRVVNLHDEDKMTLFLIAAAQHNDRLKVEPSDGYVAIRVKDNETSLI
jgi:actin-related protein